MRSVPLATGPSGPGLNRRQAYQLWGRAVGPLSGSAKGGQIVKPARLHFARLSLTGDARLEFLRNSARRLKMRERIERAG